MTTQTNCRAGAKVVSRGREGGVASALHRIIL